MRILILGASGMLGNAMMRLLAETPDLDVYGTARSFASSQYFPVRLLDRMFFGIDAENHDRLSRVVAEVEPQVVINCIGIVIHMGKTYDDQLEVLSINSLLPHRLARLCSLIRARLVHASSDCVYSGLRGGYSEDIPPDSIELYGKSKSLGEVDYPHALTLRTSLIGHALANGHGLIDWFLSQEGSVRGYSRAIFSGLTTMEFARVVRDIVIHGQELSGVYHVGAEPISKFDLLNLVARVYGKSIEIVPDETIAIDRSLNVDRFRAATGYVAPPWPVMIRRMFELR
jgi:dTDP-4-dehydrorhamnose reductase